MQQLCGVSVIDVSVAVPAGNGVEAGMVVLQEDDAPYRRIQMYVGQPEARAIRVAWRAEIPPRPSTWDLFVSTISLLGGSVEGAVLTDVEEGRHYFAELLLRPTGAAEALHVTARPSDAIAMVLRCPGATLQAYSHVLDGLAAAAVPLDTEAEVEVEGGGPGGGAAPLTATVHRPAGPKKAVAGGRVARRPPVSTGVGDEAAVAVEPPPAVERPAAVEPGVDEPGVDEPVGPSDAAGPSTVDPAAPGV